MQSTSIDVHTLDNGMTLVAESMPWLQSVAYSFSVPAGCRWDPPDKLGVANMACEMVQRGCGSRNSRDYIEALESLGIDYTSSVSVYHAKFGGAMPAQNLQAALPLAADLLRRPWIPEDQLEDGRQVCLQEIRGIEDDLAHKVMLRLRERQYGEPLGRNCQGTLETVQSIEQRDVTEFHRDYYQPDGLILAVAGKLDWPQLCDQVEELFGDWPSRPHAVEDAGQPAVGALHIPFDSQQTHIGLAIPAVSYSDENYFVARGAVGVLSDGMSSRLFNEIREKRGLCYTVYASLHSLRDRGSIFSYVGTGADRAQQSLDVLIAQLKQLQRGITREELDRLKVQVRSSLVMQQESSRARAASIATDYFHLGRARSLDEVNELINGLTVERINDYLANNPPSNFNLVTLGPAPLEIHDAVPATPTG